MEAPITVVYGAIRIPLHHFWQPEELKNLGFRQSAPESRFYIISYFIKSSPTPVGGTFLGGVRVGRCSNPHTQTCLFFTRSLL